MKISAIRTAIAVGLLAGPLAAHEYAVGDLRIDHPYAIETAATARTGAGYLTIRNEGDAPDRLIEVRTDFPRAELHTTEVDANGVARMTQLEGVEIPAGGEATLAPQGMHVMFLGLTAPLAEGERIDATLVFETAGEVAVQFNVEPRGGAEESHEHHGH